MLEPTDIDVRREVAAARRAALLTASPATEAPTDRPAPLRSLGTLLVSVGLRLAPPEQHRTPAVHVPSGRTEAPGDPGASLVAR